MWEDRRAVRRARQELHYPQLTVAGPPASSTAIRFSFNVSRTGSATRVDRARSDHGLPRVRPR